MARMKRAREAATEEATAAATVAQLREALENERKVSENERKRAERLNEALKRERRERAKERKLSHVRSEEGQSGTPGHETRVAPPKDMTEVVKAFDCPYVGDRAVLDRTWTYLSELSERSMSYEVGALCQSSGFGKSRLVKELAKEHYIVYLVCQGATPAQLKGQPSTQYPPNTEWAKQLVANMDVRRIDEELKHLDEFKRWKRSEQVVDELAARAQEVVGGVLCEMTKAIQRGDSPADWYRQQIAASCESVALVQNFSEHVATAKTAIQKWEAGANGSKEAFVAVVIDEASELLADFPNWPKGVLYRAVRRAFKEVGVALLLISTNSKVGNFVPTNANDPSAREADSAELKLPIWTLPMARNVAAVSFEDALTERHMFKYGRWLWEALNRGGRSSLDVMALARHKLLRRDGSANDAYVILTVTTGLRMHPCLVEAEDLVAYHMATLIDVSQNRKYVTCTYPSEPVLGHVASRELLVRLPSVLSTLVKWIGTAWVNEGSTGELFVRLAFICARKKESHMTLATLRERFSIHADGTALPQNSTVCFNHFVRVGQKITPEILLEALLRRAALMPLQSNQKGYDLVIPCFVGSDTTVPVTTEMVGALFIQVKNRTKSVPCPEVLESVLEAAKETGVAKHECWVVQRRLRSSDRHLAYCTSFDRVIKSLNLVPDQEAALRELEELQAVPLKPMESTQPLDHQFYEECTRVVLPQHGARE